MQWYTFAENPQIISDLYTDVPLLQGVDLIEVVFIASSAQMSLKITLPRFPDNPPRKWRENAYTAIQIHLDFLGLEDAEISHWSTKNQVSIQIEKTANEQIVLNITSATCSIQAKSHSFRISNVIGYWYRDWSAFSE